jgi:hypothetical protein
MGVGVEVGVRVGRRIVYSRGSMTRVGTKNKYPQDILTGHDKTDSPAIGALHTAVDDFFLVYNNKLPVSSSTVCLHICAQTSVHFNLNKETHLCKMHCDDELHDVSVVPYTIILHINHRV